MQVTTVGIDLAKNIFHVHGVDHTGRIVFSKPLRRAQMAEFFVGLPPCLIGMEACSGAHFWARKLQSQGHDVRLMSPQFVKPYVKSNKNDRADAQAICEAVSRPSMRFVAVKSCEQQAVLAVHRARQGFVKMRTALANQIRGLLSEFGIVMAQGLRVVLVQAGAVAADERMALPSPMRTLIGHLHQQLKQLDAQVAQLEQLIASSVQADSAERRLAASAGHRPHHQQRHRGHRGRCHAVCQWQATGRLAGVGAAPALQWGQGQTDGHQQTRRWLCAHLAHPWSALADSGQ